MKVFYFSEQCSDIIPSKADLFHFVSSLTDWLIHSLFQEFLFS
jgi:hypothetical protein